MKTVLTHIVAAGVALAATEAQAQEGTVRTFMDGQVIGTVEVNGNCIIRNVADTRKVVRNHLSTAIRDHANVTIVYPDGTIRPVIGQPPDPDARDRLLRLAAEAKAVCDNIRAE